MQQTDLKLSIGGFPPMSARNCTQELFTISGGNFYRDINGKLVFLTKPGDQKYKTIITCKDNNLPAFSGFYIGNTVNVGCIQHLWKKLEKGAHSTVLERQIVEGSIVAVDDDNNYLDFKLLDANTVVVNTQNICYVGFRPWLNMYIIDFKTEIDEWGLSSKWKLVMEEV